jgi:hypothetical protein
MNARLDLTLLFVNSPLQLCILYFFISNLLLILSSFFDANVFDHKFISMYVTLKSTHQCKIVLVELPLIRKRILHNLVSIILDRSPFLLDIVLADLTYTRI